MTSIFLQTALVENPLPSTLLSLPSDSTTEVTAVATQSLSALSKPLPWKESREERYQRSIEQLLSVKLMIEGDKKSLKNCSSQQIKSLNLTKKLEAFLLKLISFRGGVKEHRNFYSEVLSSLREVVTPAIDQPTTTSFEKSLLLDLSQAHFMLELSETHSGTSLIKQLISSLSDEQLLDYDQLDTALKQSLSSRGWGISSSDIFRKFSANCPLVNWDPASYSIRSSLGTLTLENNQEVALLRMACPVIGSCGSPEIDPLFKAYLLSLNESERHLYINNISHNPSTDVRRHSTAMAVQAELENRRANVIQELSENPKYKDKLLFVSLPHDSDFYEQIENPKNESIVSFMNTFSDCLRENKQGFYLPGSLENRDQLLADIKQDFVQIWNQYFKDPSTQKLKKELSNQERKEFISIAYAYISRRLMINYGITHKNNTCKDGVDRAMGLTAADVLLNNPSVSNQEICYVLCNAAVVNHARAPKKERTERSLAAILRMKKN